MQVHKEAIDKVPNSLPNRSNIEIEIYGMEGIPAQDLKDHEKQKNGNKSESDDDEPSAKKNKLEPAAVQAMPPQMMMPSMMPNMQFPMMMPCKYRILLVSNEYFVEDICRSSWFSYDARNPDDASHDGCKTVIPCRRDFAITAKTNLPSLQQCDDKRSANSEHWSDQYELESE